MLVNIILFNEKFSVFPIFRTSCCALTKSYHYVDYYSSLNATHNSQTYIEILFIHASPPFFWLSLQIDTIIRCCS